MRREVPALDSKAIASSAGHSRSLATCAVRGNASRREKSMKLLTARASLSVSAKFASVQTINTSSPGLRALWLAPHSAAGGDTLDVAAATSVACRLLDG